MTTTDHTRTGDAPAIDPAREHRPGVRSRGGRAARRAFRARRAYPAIVVSAVLAAAAILTAAEIISALLDRGSVLLPMTSLARFGRNTHWDHLPALVIAGAAGAVGLLLLALALWPRHPRAVALASGDPDVVLGISWGGLCRHLAQAAEGVDGIARTKVKIGRRRIRVRAASPLRDTGGLADQVRQAVTDRIDRLAPLRHPRVRVTVRRGKD
jgi:uncharacterized protein DUF6286